jgi:hypothetical protein
MQLPRAVSAHKNADSSFDPGPDGFAAALVVDPEGELIGAESLPGSDKDFRRFVRVVDVDLAPFGCSGDDLRQVVFGRPGPDLPKRTGETGGLPQFLGERSVEVDGGVGSKECHDADAERSQCVFKRLVGISKVDPLRQFDSVHFVL